MNMLATHFNGKLSEMRQREMGRREYIWTSMDDGKVRPAHIANNGKIFIWEEPPETGHPDEESNCRRIALSIKKAPLFQRGFFII